MSEQDRLAAIIAKLRALSVAPAGLTLVCDRLQRHLNGQTVPTVRCDALRARNRTSAQTWTATPAAGQLLTCVPFFANNSDVCVENANLPYFCNKHEAVIDVDVIFSCHLFNASARGLIFLSYSYMQLIDIYAHL